MKYVSHEIRASLKSVSGGLVMATVLARKIQHTQPLLHILSDIEACCSMAEGVIDEMLLTERIEDDTLKLDLKATSISSIAKFALQPMLSQVSG
jgi:signal transduction histidine kinase